jgi:hypothetical protein
MLIKWGVELNLIEIVVKISGLESMSNKSLSNTYSIHT